MIIRNGLLHDAVRREPYVADIRVENGRIVKIAVSIEL
jgi:N-acyl-D-aspartate/D-glutamate deacylase